MRTKSITFIPFLMLIIFVFSINNSVYSFSSVTGNQGRNGKDIHAKITHPIVDRLGFSYISFRVLLTGVVSADYYKNLINDASMHCDRNREVSNLEALNLCHQKFKAIITFAHQEIKANNYLSSLYFLGQALHIGQDLISHSNLALIDKTTQNKIINQFISGKKISEILTLKLTYWDHRDNKKNVSSKENLSRSDTFNHQEFSLDSPKKNKWCKKKINNSTKTTQFHLAFRLAQMMTKRILKNFFKTISKEDVAKLKKYNH
jgi:hypothetical protein